MCVSFFYPVKILGRVQQYMLKTHTTWLKRKFYNTSIHTLEVLKVSTVLLAFPLTKQKYSYSSSKVASKRDKSIQ